MPVPTAILFGLASFAAVMALVGWWLDPAAAPFHAWIYAKVTEGGLWSGFVLFLLAAGYFAWRADRTGKGSEGAN